jgi:hypothetical protein
MCKERKIVIVGGGASDQTYGTLASFVHHQAQLNSLATVFTRDLDTRARISKRYRINKFE